MFVNNGFIDKVYNKILGNAIELFFPNLIIFLNIGGRIWYTGYTIRGQNPF